MNVLRTTRNVVYACWATEIGVKVREGVTDLVFGFNCMGSRSLQLLYLTCTAFLATLS